MSYITLKCKNCGASMSLNTESHSATCNHCSSTFLIADLLDEKDIAFVSKLSPKDLEQKMLASDALKKGETFLAQGDYENAENSFKKAIEFDDSNYRSYLGVVKAKTQNLNKIPDNDDYLQYAHYALSLATGDDLVLVKSELSKLDLLTLEKRRQKKTIASNQKREERLRQHKKEVSKIFSMIAIFIILMFGGFVFVSSMFSDIIFGSSEKILNVNVDSYESLSRILSSEKYLDYNINLTADIDCGGNKLSPLGTPTKPFTGSLIGNKHKISNAIIDTSNSYYVGIFGCTVLANINNLVLDNIEINVDTTPKNKTQNFYGLISGKSEGTTITNIEIKNTCKIKISRDIEYLTTVGGLVGHADKSCFISNISSHANIDLNLTQANKPANTYIGGIAGICQRSIIEKSCSNSSILTTITNTCYRTSSSYIGGIIGQIQANFKKDVTNINNNFFSGYINTSVPSIVITTVAGIANCSLSSDKKLNNHCLYNSSKYILNAANLNASQLGDYAENQYFVTFEISNDNYLSKLSDTFAKWDYSDTFEPCLK